MCKKTKIEKRIYLIRHSKSSWKDKSLEDFKRPLNKRGKKDSQLMGKLLKRKGIYPDLIISSPAKRALKTAINIAKSINYPIEEIEFNIDIYEASIKDILKIIKSIKEKNRIVFLIGHNPSLNLLLDYLIKSHNIDNIVTSGIVELGFNGKWSNIEENNIKLLSYEYPKKYY